MDANRRPTQGSGPPSAGGGGGSGVDLNAPAEGDWRAKLPPEARSRIVNKIMETLKNCLPVSGPEGLDALLKIAARFEERTYTAATDQSNYLRTISLKMVSMEMKTQQAPVNAQVIPNQNDPGQGSKNRASWTDGQTDMLIVMMKEYADASQYRGQNGWTKEGWNFMAARLNKPFNRANFTVKQVKYKEQRLKREYTIVKSILDRNGFCWDHEKKVPKSIGGKWDELSQEQRKWRFKEFPHYDDLHGIYEGRTIQEKQCKRTTDVFEERYNSLPLVPREETFTEQVIRASKLNSPSPTLEAPGLGDGNYDRDRCINGDDVDLSYGAYSETMGNNPSNFASDEKYKLLEAPPKKKAKHSKGSDGGKPKKGKDVAIDNLVAVKKEEPETYKDVKTEQIESYRDI